MARDSVKVILTRVILIPFWGESMAFESRLRAGAGASRMLDRIMKEAERAHDIVQQLVPRCPVTPSGAVSSIHYMHHREFLFDRQIVFNFSSSVLEL